MHLHQGLDLIFFSILQMYGDLHGHTEHLHEDGDDSGQWRQWQKEVNGRILTLASVLPSTELHKIMFYY